MDSGRCINDTEERQVATMSVFSVCNVLFDLDGTLAATNQGSSIETIVLMRKLLEHPAVGCVGLLTGKPLDLLIGFSRQFVTSDESASKLILAGNNGYKSQIGGIAWPPKIEHRLCDWRAEDFLPLKRQLAGWEGVWSQPNDCGVTVFAEERQTVREIAAVARGYVENGLKADVFEHVDAVDIMPPGVNKGVFMKAFFDGELGIKPDPRNTWVVGDGSNDVPMMTVARQYGGKAYAVGNDLAVAQAADQVFSSIEAFLKKALKEFDSALAVGK
jgi:hydroxymethylpyrimidine pyrophosphatase-like HAD family hydrolase